MRNPLVLVFAIAISLIIGFRAGSSPSVRDVFSFNGALNPSIERDETLKDDLDVDKLQETYDRLVQQYDGELSFDELVEGAVDGLVRGVGDQHTDYLSPDEASQFVNSLNGDLIGIGAYIGARDGFVEIIQPIEGSPAETAGIRPGDLVLSVDGATTAGMSPDAAAAMIRGESGTSVRLQIQRGDETLEIDITREKISVPSVRSQILSGDIGMIRLTRFEQDSFDEIVKAWEGLQEQGATKLVFDLRNNGGGFLDSAVDIAGLWLNDNQVVLIQRRSDTQTETTSDTKDVFSDVPTVILANEFSASASEILAGALRDNSYAQIVGATTFGKGSVQRIYNFEDGSLVKITEAHWFTPNDLKIHENGLEPDIEVETDESIDDDAIDAQEAKAVEILSE